MKEDPTAAARKKDHIDLAFTSRVDASQLDQRFDYEPMLSPHPTSIVGYPKSFLDKQIQAPIWVSSMTGGTELAKTININIAKACKEFGLGMGLGSCRSILDSDERLSDFAVRDYIGDQSLYANLGIAQLEYLIDNNKFSQVDELIKKLQADGLIIHVNPLQEWLQSEGDMIHYAPIDTIKRVLDLSRYSIIVKEVGQGINAFEGMAKIGQSVDQMISIINGLIPEMGHKVLCRNFIISGGVKDYLDGYYYINELKHNAIYGQASEFLKRAQGDYEDLRKYVELQMTGLSFASAYLRNKR